MRGGATDPTTTKRTGDPPEPATARQRRWPTLVVLAAIAALTIGGRAVADALSGPLGPSTGFPQVVTIEPGSGWRQTAYEDTPGAEQLTLAKGAVRLTVTGMPGYQGDALQLAEAYLQARSAQVASFGEGGIRQGTLPSGLPAAAFAYSGVTPDGSAVIGTVTATVGQSGNGVVFDAYGPEQDLTGAIASGELRSMIDGAAIP
ncbi:MAG: hypothetical protein ACM3OO_07765 [Planctomycetaceae bacterium]